AGLIFISGGMNIAWSNGFRGPIYYTTTSHNFVAWFIGGIIGALISCALTNKVAKKFVLLFASLLVTIGGLVIACTKNNGSATVAGCYLDGIANGLVFAPFVALAGEVSVPYKRGSVATNMEQLCYGIGILLQIIYASTWSYGSYYYTSFSPEMLKGILSTVYGVLGLALGYFMTIESPVLMLVNNDEQGAIDALRRLQKPHTLTEETYDQLAEHKRYIAMNKEMSLGESISQAIPSFIRLALLRALNAMSISLYVSYCLTFSILISYGLGGSKGWYVAFAFCRWLGNCIPSFWADSLGRKKPILLGLLVAGGLAFAIGSQYKLYKYLDGVTVMILIFEFFAGMAFTGTSAYLSEAYPLGVKQHFIAFTFIVEMLVFLIIGVIDFNLYSAGSDYFYAVGALYLVGFIMGVLTLPETKWLTLRGAQERFSRFLNTRF
ncbi:hypothetical protein KR009_002446, partial [Drosophila setifemur]